MSRVVALGLTATIPAIMGIILWRLMDARGLLWAGFAGTAILIVVLFITEASTARRSKPPDE